MNPVRALLRKELLDLARNRGALIPVVIATGVFLTLPLLITVVIPSATSHALGDDTDLVRASAVMGLHPELSTDGRVQLFLFQQFLTVFLLTPITGAMALAAHTIVGEKQARSLEPLLATPITTSQLLVAKVLGALLPTLAIAAAGLVAYGVIIGAAAEPGVVRAMLSARSAMLVFAIGPAAALVSLQLAIIVSSRVNDARTAQQFGVLLILPLAVLLVGQFAGSLWLSPTSLGLIALGLFGAWLLLVAVSVTLFDREAILTRWK
jgi:ABC-2 type transport system permease protein